jgi:hypothetical protein
MEMKCSCCQSMGAWRWLQCHNWDALRKQTCALWKQYCMTDLSAIYWTWSNLLLHQHGPSASCKATISGFSCWIISAISSKCVLIIIRKKVRRRSMCVKWR